MGNFKENQREKVDQIFTECRTIAGKVLDKIDLDLCSISRELGSAVAYSTLSAYRSQNENPSTHRNIPFALMVALEREFSISAGLCYHAEKLGYLVIPLPTVKDSAGLDIVQAANAIRESSEAIIELANAIADNKIDDAEIGTLNKEIMEAITALMSFKKNCIDRRVTQRS